MMACRTSSAVARSWLWPLAGLLLLLAFNGIFAPGFFRLAFVEGRLVGNPVHIAVQSSKIILVAIGMTLVIATKGVDLSVGSVMAISGSTAAVLAAAGASFPSLFAASLAAGAAVGLTNGLLVAGLRIQPIVATLIFMVLGRGVAMLIAGGQPRPIQNETLLFLGSGHFWILPLPPLLALAALLATAAVVRFTPLGLFIAAAGSNETAARLAGLPAARIKALVYTFSGIAAACAGLIAAARVETADPSRLGELVELDAIFAVVVGGTALTGGRFSLAGSLAGALLIQTLTLTMINQGMPPEITPVPKALVIVAVCLLQSGEFRKRAAGLFRRPAAA
ncbi:MAG TPA: ABC transporter permease [Verrucomicrobiales bacterium]|nr:ABC transporter permease [Verrucomicrobiales bacterium]